MLCGGIGLFSGLVEEVRLYVTVENKLVKGRKTLAPGFEPGNPLRETGSLHLVSNLTLLKESF